MPCTPKSATEPQAPEPEAWSPKAGSLPYNLPMISKDLLDILVCPACKKPLVMKDNGESLKCGECHRVYPIRDDIPVLLVDEAVIEP
ncbi:MAG TPA: Trm112 family protein [Terriglobales bacterium]